MLNENWHWKPESVSPNGALNFIDPNWLSIDTNLLENAVHTDESILYDEPNARNEAINKFLSNNNELLQDEPLQDWLEKKINFSVYDGFPIQNIENNDIKIQAFVNPAKVIPETHLQFNSLSTPCDITQSIQIETFDEPNILQEFDDILNSNKECFEFNSMEITSDPPTRTINQDELYALVMQNPPLSNTDAFSYIEDQTSTSLNSPHSSINSEEMPVVVWDIDQSTDSTESKDVRSDDEGEDNKEGETKGGEKEEENIDNESEDIYIKDESLSSPSSDSYISENIDSAENSNDDPDWSINKSHSNVSGKKVTRKYTRTQPYTRKPYVKVSPDERKVRKKEQNKNAATRYRQKKKQEILEIVNEEQQLVEKNKDLREKITDIEREIRYLKNLLRDLYTVKGLLK